jgi:LmbE family N-acetylglucosaminyl deacetylase
MAHPDDCEFLAAGTLALMARKGWQIHIVTMTAGDAGSTTLGPEQIGAIRREEAMAAAKIINATYHCLEERDLFVTYNEPTLRRAISLTRRIGPSLVITHGLEDYMIDHEETARIARSVTFGYSIPNVAPGPIPKGAAVPHLYYADPIEGKNAYGNRIDPTTLVDVTETMTVKAQMLKAHASQRQWLREHHGIDEYIESMKRWGSVRGQQIGVEFAEGFRQHRGHGYPQDCLLKEQLGSRVTHKS